MGSSQQKLVEKTTMNLVIATALAVLGIAAAEPGYRYGGYGGHGGYGGYGGYGHYLGKRSAEAEAVAEPGYGFGGYGGYHGGYGGYGGYGHYLGKRSAEAEPGYRYGGY